MMDNIHRTLAENGLVRARQDKLLGGVASGLGRRIGVEPWPARLLFVLVLLLLPGSQPGGLRGAMTFGAAAVATGVIRLLFVPAVVALRDMAPEGGGPTQRDGA